MFRKVAERVVHQGPFVRVAVATFEGPDGQPFERELIRHDGAAAVVALSDDRSRAYLVRQYRPAVDDHLLELPAGKLDVVGEPPHEAARRELEEEAGRRAVDELELLTRYAVAVGLTDEWMHLYLCERSEPCPASPQSAEEEHMEVVEVALDDVPKLVADGTIVDAKTIIGLLLARERFGTSR